MKFLLYLLLMTISALGASLTLTGNMRLSGGMRIGPPPAAVAITDLTQISNLFIYLKQGTLLTNVSGNPASNGNSVMTWGDSSGNQRHCTTNRPATPPSYVANAQNGQDGVYFDTLQTLAVGFTPQTDTTIFVVGKVTGVVSFRVAVDSTNSASRQLVYKENTASKYSIYSGTALSSSTGLVLDQWYILTAQFNSGGNDIGRTNSLQDISGDAGGQSLDGLSVGAQHDGTLHWADIIGCVAIYNRLLTATEMDTVEAILGQQFGITTF